MNRKLRMGMVGGGKDAFIGAIHRLAANMDGLIELCCGALSINPDIAKESGASLFLPEHRTYLTYDEMITKESQLRINQILTSNIELILNSKPATHAVGALKESSN